MTKKLALLGGVLILVAALAIPALAGWRGGWNDDHMGGSRGWYGGHMMGSRLEVGLSEEQLEELATARLKFRGETLELRQQMAQKEAELRALMLDPEATDQALLAKQNELDQQYNELSQKRLLYQRDIAKRLPELGRKRGWGRGERGQGPDVCPVWDRDGGRGYRI